jgi:hypothetical protein
VRAGARTVSVPYQPRHRPERLVAGGHRVLEARGGDGQDVLVALARQVVQPADAPAESLEALFAQQRRDEADDEGYIIDGAWEGVVPWRHVPSTRSSSTRR